MSWFIPTGTCKCDCRGRDSGCNVCYEGTKPATYNTTLSGLPTVLHSAGAGYSGDGLFGPMSFATEAEANAESCDSTEPVGSITNNNLTMPVCQGTALALMWPTLNQSTGGFHGWNPRKHVVSSAFTWDVYCDLEFAFSMVWTISLLNDRIRIGVDITVQQRPPNYVDIRNQDWSHTDFAFFIEFPGITDCMTTIAVALSDMTESGSSGGCSKSGIPTCPLSSLPAELANVQLTFDPAS